MKPSAEADRPVRRRLMFSGHVQGVGFRYTALRVAQDLPISGYVRNLDSGEVEAVAEGRPADLDEFLRRLSDRMGYCIRHLDVEESPGTGEFDGFDVKF